LACSVLGLAIGSAKLRTKSWRETLTQHLNGK